MKITRTIAELRQAIRSLRASGKRIALVPTMGALHSGHISLVKEGFVHADAVVVSLFVNPTQFAAGEDFATYPRTEDADIAALQATNVTIAYLPDVKEMYPAGAVTRVQVSGMSSESDGAFRPGHFDGVATVVTKLFMQALPDIAVFGEKDFQQLVIIKRLTADLDIPVRIIGAPIIRDTDGLALSSRNRYLSASERMVAPAMYKILSALAAVIPANGANTLLDEAKTDLLAAGFSSVDYIELRDAAKFTPLDHIAAPARLLAAVHIGTTRLIDNIEVLPHERRANT